MNRLALCALPLALAGCPITETGNPEFNAQLTLRATSSAPEVVDVAAPPGTASVDAAWIAVERLRFVRGSTCDVATAEEIDVPGPFVTDAASVLPAIISARLPTDDYCRVRVRLEPAATIGDAPAELLGHTVLVRGVRADGTPWQIRSTEEVDADVRAATPIALSEASASLIVAFDVATWLNGVDLDGATPGVDGVIHVEEDQNEALLEVFDENLEEALELHHDDDDDGELDEDEDDEDEEVETEDDP